MLDRTEVLAETNKQQQYDCKLREVAAKTEPKALRSDPMFIEENGNTPSIEGREGGKNRMKLPDINSLFA